LGRTVGELLDGSPAHNAISAAEVVEWQAVWKLRAFEQEEAMRKAQNG